MKKLTMKKLTKKFTLCLVLIVFSISFLMGEEKYADIKNLLAKQGEIFQNFINGCEIAKNAQDAAKSITNFKDGFKNLIPTIIAVSNNYGDLAAVMETNPPETLKPDLEKINEYGPKINAAFEKISIYMSDPEVIKTFQEFQQVMLDLKKELAPEKKIGEPQKNTEEQKKTEEQKQE